MAGGASFTLEGAQLDAALQYSPTLGLPQLLRHLDTLRHAYHAPVSLASVASGSEAATTTAAAADDDPGGNSRAAADVPRLSMVSTGSQVTLVRLRSLARDEIGIRGV